MSQTKKSQTEEFAKMKNDVPRSALNVTMEDGTTFELVDGNDNDKRQRFRMRAASGIPILNHPHWGNFAVDLEGLKIGKKRKYAALFDHDTSRRVGYTTTIDKTEEGLVAEGVFLDTPDAKEVQELLDAGFPMQASVYIPPTKIQRLSEGESAEVNGHTIHGPGHIFRQSSLREVTFTTLGADENTYAAAMNESVTINAVTFTANETEAVMPENEIETEDVVNSVSDQDETTTGDQFAEQVKSNEDSFNEGVQSERKRILSLLDNHCTGQFSLTKSLIEDGTPLEQGVTALLKDMQENVSERLQAKMSATPEPVGPVDQEEPQDPQSKFESNPELVEQFGEFEVYQAYQRAVENGSVRDERN